MAVVKFQSKSHRLISSIYPTIGLFDEFGTPEEAQAAMELECLTNDRMTGALGRLNAIPESDWALQKHGNGAHTAMAAFLHPSPTGARFNKPDLGAWYAALDLDTAIAETIYHNTRRLAASAGGFPNRMQLRELVSSPSASLIDLIGEQEERHELFHDSDYSASQIFADQVRKEGHDGIIYESVRRQGGTNIVIFRPRLLMPVLQGDHYEYNWDAAGKASVHKMTNIKV